MKAATLLLAALAVITSSTCPSAEPAAVDEQACIKLTTQYRAGMKALCDAMQQALNSGWDYLASANDNDIWFVQPAPSPPSAWVRVEYREPIRGVVKSSRHLYTINCTRGAAQELQSTAFGEWGLRGAPVEHSNARGEWVTAPPGTILDVLVKAACAR